MSKTPVTIISGYLGAGKTTLVNYILHEQKSKKIAVIENEFGEISIDTELVGENIKAKEDLVTMANGCVCCTVRGDLVKALLSLEPRRGEFEAILLETTGIADPGPIISTFQMNQLIHDSFQIDAVVTLVDAKHVEQHIDEERNDSSVNEAQQQLAFADKIVLNKIDLVSRKKLRHIKRRIQSINAFAEVIEAQKSRVDLNSILNLNAFDLERAMDIDENLLDEDVTDCDDSECSDLDHHHDHHHHHHQHTNDHKHDDHGHSTPAPDSKGASPNQKHSGHKRKAASEGETGRRKKKKKKHDLNSITTVGFRIEGSLDEECFNMTLAYILNAHRDDIFRSKGVIALEDESKKYVFQGVHENINFAPSLQEWDEKETRINKLVFIGRSLHKEELGDMLRKCVFPVSNRLDVIEDLQSLLDDFNPPQPEPEEEDESDDEEFQRTYALTRAFAIMAYNVRRLDMTVPHYLNELTRQNQVPAIVTELQISTEMVVATVERIMQEQIGASKASQT